MLGLGFIWKSKRFLQVILNKNSKVATYLPRCRCSGPLFLSFVYPNYFKSPSIDFLLCRFWNHKVFHENQSRRGLKLRKTERRLNFGLTWPIQLNWPRHVFFLWTGRRHARPLSYRLKMTFHSSDLIISFLDFFMKLKDGVTRKSLGLISYFLVGRSLRYWPPKFIQNHFSRWSENRGFIIA